MVLALARLGDFRDVLERFLPPGVPWDVEIEMTRFGGLGPRALAYPCTYAPAAGEGLVQLGESHPGTILLARWEPETAAGQALLTHEAIHQIQMQEPGFLDAFRREEARRLRAGEPVHMNVYELPAYEHERVVWCSLVNEDWEPGSWLPLGVSLWGCE